MRRDALRLQDIVEAADALGSGGLVQDAILRQLTVAGEAALKLSPELRERHTEVPWMKVAGFRHRVVHDYFGLDLDAVWIIATHEIPILRSQVIAILATCFPREADEPNE